LILPTPQIEDLESEELQRACGFYRIGRCYFESECTYAHVDTREAQKYGDTISLAWYASSEENIRWLTFIPILPYQEVHIIGPPKSAVNKVKTDFMN
jgi:hypothetical protein